MDLVQEMLKYADYLYKKAFALCGEENDAKDLVQETYLSALIFIKKGNDIQNVKSYLLQIMKNKYIDMYNKKKNSLLDLKLINVNTGNSESYVSDTGLKKTEVVNAIRRELAYLPKIYREVMIQYYVEKKSVKEVASNLNISSNSVLVRLDRGRDKVKKGIYKMEPLVANSFNPDHLMLVVDGRLGPNNEPNNIITNMIEQNVLILAYEKPIPIKTISEKLVIPTAFVEEAVDKLVKNEFMKSVGSKVYTNFPIIDDIFMQNLLKAQKKYVDKTYKKTNVIITCLLEEYKKLNIFNEFNKVQLYLYSLTTILLYVRNHLSDVFSLLRTTDYPDRPDGGKWIISFGCKRDNVDNELIDFVYINRYLFTLSNSCEVSVLIFDTPISPSLVRLSTNIELTDVCKLLYFIRKEEKHDHSMMHLINDLMRFNFIYKDERNILKSDIPVLTHTESQKLEELNKDFAMKYIEVLGDNLKEMVMSNSIKYPKHISPVSYITKLIFMKGLSPIYSKKFIEKGIITVEKDINYPVAYIIENK